MLNKTFSCFYATFTCYDFALQCGGGGGVLRRYFYLITPGRPTQWSLLIINNTIVLY